MKVLIFIALFIAAASAEKAEICNSSKCALKDGCVCASEYSPIDIKDTPQFVMVTFDDAVGRMVYDGYYKPLLGTRKNPDGKKITATFFVPHEYTDYQCVNELYNAGHEIATHSISKSGAEYWKEASEDVLVSEFDGQKKILSKFANIPIRSITGARVPFLELRGNPQFSAFKKSAITHDNTWTSLSKNKYFPYTLKYLSAQNCLIGTCPDEIFDSWVIPLNNLQGNKSKECNVLFGCEIEGTAVEIKNWLVTEFERSYKDQRAPMTLMINYAYFGFVENSFEGLKLFFDHLATLKDVFLVSQTEVLDWMKNPVKTADYKTTVTEKKAECKKVVCELQKDKELRYVTVCGTCPKQYPWIGNPEGKVT